MSVRNVFMSFHVTRVQFWWRAFIFVYENKSSSRTYHSYVVSWSSKTFRFCTHVLHTICIRDKFGSRMSTRCTNILVRNVCVRKFNILHTHFYTHTFYKHFTHTNTNYKMSSKRYRRHFVTREYFRVLATQNK